MSNSCPAVSHAGLDCDKVDEYTPHQTLTHRNDEEEREWPITDQDRVRWGMVQEKRKKSVAVTGVEEVVSDADVTTEDALNENEEIINDNPE